VDLGKYSELLSGLSTDSQIPKYATHLIYLSKADRRNEIEEKVIKSIFSKKPKRADVYWFLHINRVNEPYTLTYDISELVEDKVIKVNLNIGFRVQSRAELFFKKIVTELVANKELNLHVRPDGSTRYNPEPDFRFIVIEKYLSVENDFHLFEGMILKAHYFLKRISLSDTKAFGIDKSDVVVEQVPIVFQPVLVNDLKRINQ
jgi:KUP system potassium uptake protein